MFTNVPTQQQEFRSNAGAIAGTKQVKQLPAVPALTQLQQAHIVPVLQMVLDENNVKAKAVKFLKCHDEERELIYEANNLLTVYSKKGSTDNFNKLNNNLPGIRDKINTVTDFMADIIGEYADCKNGKIREDFFKIVLDKNSNEIGPLFDQLIGKIILGKDKSAKLGNGKDDNIIEDKNLDDKNLNNNIIEDKNLDDKNLNSNIIEDKNLDDKNLNSNIIEDKNLDDKNQNNNIIEDKNLDDKNLNSNIIEDKNLDDKNLNSNIIEDNIIEDKDIDVKFKNRFLSYVLQSMKFETGAGRVKELMRLIGNRTITINTLEMGGPKAGQLDPENDNPKSEKTDKRDKNKDKELLKKVGGNLAEFVKEKRKLGDRRIVNPDSKNIGNLQIFMDSSDKLLPVYYGLRKNEEVEAYTSPMFTAVHHELGHLTNALKGKHGRKEDKYSDEKGLSGLTDEEELYNISLDKFSDKAFSDELRLPERIAHTSFGGLDKGSFNDELDEKLLSSDMRLWDEKTYGRKKYYDLIDTIKTITDESWSKHTSWRFKPSGVQTIAAEIKEINGNTNDIKKQLETVKKYAIKFKDEKSSDRTEVTQKFYEALAKMSLDSEETINNTRLELKNVWELLIIK